MKIPLRGQSGDINDNLLLKESQREAKPHYEIVGKGSLRGVKPLLRNYFPFMQRIHLPILGKGDKVEWGY